MAEKLTACDPAEGLASGETIAAFMEEAFRTDDAPYIAHTLGVMARAQGMTQIANETCLRANSFTVRSARPAIRISRPSSRPSVRLAWP